MKILILLTCLIASVAHADIIKGTVVYITDGDTVKVVDVNNKVHKIRLAGIDAPEKRQKYGKASSMELANCALDKKTVVHWNKLDRYKRVVGVVYINGKDCNLNQIKKGVAYHYKKYQKEQTPEQRKQYDRAEQVAQGMKYGVWSSNDTIPPWEYRKIKRNKNHEKNSNNFSL